MGFGHLGASRGRRKRAVRPTTGGDNWSIVPDRAHAAKSRRLASTPNPAVTWANGTHDREMTTRARPPMLLIATAAALTVSTTGCAKVYGSPDPPVPTVHAPEASPTAAFDGLPARIAQATDAAAADGATISIAVLDRVTSQMLFNDNDQLVAIASVAKLFIADDLLSQESSTPLSAGDRQALDGMLRSSDDGAAETFWAARGGGAVIHDLAARYGLTSTTPPSDGQWWDTTSSASDLVRYYDRLLSGSGGLPGERAEIILNDLAGSTAARRPRPPPRL